MYIGVWSGASRVHAAGGHSGDVQSRGIISVTSQAASATKTLSPHFATARAGSLTTIDEIME